MALAGHSRKMMSSKQEDRNFWLYTSPWIIGFIGLMAIPFFTSLLLSFTQWDILTPSEWVGLANYKTLFQDAEFWAVLRNTLYYTLIGVPLQITFGLTISVVLLKSIRGISFFRTVFYLPSIFGGVAVLLLWSFMFAPGNGGTNMGFINGFLHFFGIQGPGWSQDIHWAKPAVIIITLWNVVGKSMVIFIPALSGIPQDMLEAAEIDGASRIRRFFKIVLPLITPAIFFQMTIAMIEAFKIFLEPLMIPGAMKIWTDSMMVFLFNNGFRFFKMGYASSIAWILFVFVMVFTLINFYVSKKWVHYESK